MGMLNGWIIKHDTAEENNYKYDIFDTVDQSNEVIGFSAVKKYFNKLYNTDAYLGSNFDSFQVSQSIEGVYAAEQTNKFVRLQDCRSMAVIPEIAQAIDMICYAADVPDEDNTIVHLKVKDSNLEPQDVEAITEAAQEYFDLFDFDNNIIEYIRKFVVEGQLCWENIVAKDELDQGIIGINFIPPEAYEFAFDMKARRKIGIMITNTAVDTYNIALANGITNIPNAGPVNVAGLPVGYFNELGDEKVLVLPFEQLTYIDSGVYSSDNKIVYAPIERARRAVNQLTMIEDAVLIYRMVRSPEKYVFNVDIGRMGAAKGQQKVAQLMKQFATKKTYDPATGTVGKAYDPMQMMESFWFVKSADSEGITVNPMTSSHNFGNLDDLEYFLKKVCRAMCVPIARYFEANVEVKTGNAEGGISAEELNFAKFIMSLQKRFALGLLNGLTTHLKFKGLWDLYGLNRNKLDIIFTPPIEYQQYRRQKLLESKLAMIKAAVGEERATKMFSDEYVLTNFMGWNQNQISENKKQQFLESIEQKRQSLLLSNIEKTGKMEEGDDTLKNILLKDIEYSDTGAETSPSDSGSDTGGGEDEFGGSESDFGGSDDFGGSESDFGGGESGETETASEDTGATE